MRYGNIVRLYRAETADQMNGQFRFDKNIHNFGDGYYTTNNAGLALDLVNRLNNSNDVHLKTFRINLDRLSVIDFDELNSLNWLAEILWNRQPDLAKHEIVPMYKVDTQMCDLIIGRRPGQSYFTVARSFLTGQISLQKMNNLLDVQEDGSLYVFKQKEALNRLEFLNDRVISSKDLYNYKAHIENSNYTSKMWRDAAYNTSNQGQTMIWDILTGNKQ